MLGKVPRSSDLQCALTASGLFFLSRVVPGFGAGNLPFPLDFLVVGRKRAQEWPVLGLDPEAALTKLHNFHNFKHLFQGHLYLHNEI